MKFVTVRDLRAKSGQVWENLSTEKDLVLTNNGKPIALLSAITEESLEPSLKAVRRARAMDAVEKIQTRARKLGLDKMTLDEINSEIKAYRREQRK